MAFASRRLRRLSVSIATLAFCFQGGSNSGRYVISAIAGLSRRRSRIRSMSSIVVASS
jgi:hypothetical protein